MPQIELTDEQLVELKKSGIITESIEEIASLDELIGNTYCFQCARYIYHGKVKRVNATFIQLENAGVVFETGDYTDREPTDRQALDKGVLIMRQSIESIYKLNW